MGRQLGGAALNRVVAILVILGLIIAPGCAGAASRSGGPDTVGLFDPTTGVFHLRYANAAGPADLTFGSLGESPGWVPITGD